MKENPNKMEMKVVLDEPAFDVTEERPFNPLQQGTIGAAGYDVIANIKEPIHIIFDKPAMKIPTGIRLEMPAGMAAMVMSRSGLGVKHGVVVAQGVGLIDSDYRGEIIVPLVKSTKGSALTVNPGDRIAQIVFIPVAAPDFNYVEELGESDRGEGGFGSTGGIAQSIQNDTRYSKAQPGNEVRREVEASKLDEPKAPKGNTIPAPNEGKNNVIDDTGTGFIQAGGAPKGSKKGGKVVNEKSESKSDNTKAQPTPQI